MGTNVGTIDLDLALQSDSFRKQLQQTVNRAVRNTNQQLGRVGSAGSALSGAFGKLGKVIAGAFAVSKITAFGKECLSLGSDLAEVQNVVDVTFGGLSGSVDKFAKNAAKQFGLSETMAKKYAGTYGSMAEVFGFTQKQALDMSEALTGLTGDVASFYNISQDEAYTKIKSVFSGETETLKDLGVVMTQSALDAYALSSGFGKTTAEMSEAEKVSLRYAFVQEKLANAQGDYARTSDGWANSTRTLALQFDTLKAELGQGLINVFSPIVQWLNIIVERLTAAATKFKEFTAAIMGVSANTSSGVGSTTASTVTGAVSDFVDHVSQKAEEVYDQYIAPAIQRIWDGINSLVTFLTGIWQQYISPFLDTIAQGVAELIHDHLKPMADTLLEAFGKVVELISILWKQYVEPFIEWWIANVAPIIMPVLREIWALVKLVAKDVIDKIKNVLKILGGLLDFLIGVFTGDWSSAWNGIQEIFDGFVETHKDSSKNLADFLKETFDNMATSIDQIFGRIREAAQGLYLKVKEKFESIQQTMSAVWENIKAIFSDPKAYFQEKFSAAADAVKYAFSGIRQWFSDLWNDVTESLKAPVNSMIDILNYLIGKLNTLSFDIPDWVPELGGRTFGFQIPEIPYLANGGYVKANTPRLAVIGDNRREGEIVAPESKIAEAVARAMQMVLAATQGSSSIGAAKDETPMQVNVWLGNELLAQQLTKLQKKNDYRSGGLA